MKSVLFTVIATLLLVSLLPVALIGEEEEPKIPAGQELFLANKCDLCHTVYAAGIGEPPKKTEAKVEEEEDTGIVLPPDLSIIGVIANWGVSPNPSRSRLLNSMLTLRRQRSGGCLASNENCLMPSWAHSAMRCWTYLYFTRLSA